MRSITLRSFFVAFVIVATTTNCGTSASLLSSGSALMSALAKNADLSKFKNMLTTPGLEKLLGEALKGNFTMLAPTNKALDDLGMEMHTKLNDPANVSELAKVVSNHIVPGKLDASSVMKGGMQSAAGKTLDMEGVTLGNVISDKNFNIYPVDQVMK